MRRLVFKVWIFPLCAKNSFLMERGIEKVYYIRLKKKRDNKWMQFFTFMQRFYYLKGNLSIANVCILLLLIILSNSAIKAQCKMVFTFYFYAYLRNMQNHIHRSIQKISRGFKNLKIFLQAIKTTFQVSWIDYFLLKFFIVEK